MSFQVLEEVEQGEYAADTLLKLAAPLSSRDAGLASQIVFGCLRFQAQLDFLIFHYSRRQASQLDQAIQIVLRMALFQLRYLDRIPPHAAVSEAVELAKSKKRAAAGLVNAVLRKANRDPVRWPDRATELSCPEWLLARWAEQFGQDQAESIARAALEEPERYLRVPDGSEPPPGVTLEPTEIPGCYRVTAGSTENLRLQDIGSQSIIPLLDLQPGHTFLDLCAAPGNKTTQALETDIRAVACDISLRRLRTVPNLCPRVVLDAAQPLPFCATFDRILVDAPCSGTGTLGRNPEIKWRVQPQDLARFQALQVKILTRALEKLTKGGRLIYSTCSLENEENAEVVHGVLKKPGISARIIEEKWRIPGQKPGDGFYTAVLTSEQPARQSI